MHPLHCHPFPCYHSFSQWRNDMPLLTLQPSTIDLIAERMRRDGYASPDVLVCEALASLKAKVGESTKSIPQELRTNDAEPESDLQDTLDLDLSYESIPLQEIRSVDVTFVNAGKLQTIPFGGNQ